MLFLAGLSEIIWAVGLKFSNGFRKPIATSLVIGFSILSLYFLTQAIKQIPLGLAYAIWGGIGSVGLLACGHFLYGEHINGLQFLFVILVIIGILGIKVSS